MLRLHYLLLTILASHICDAYKILVIFPTQGKSHGILGEGYVRLLLEAGHEVTYITPFPKKDPHKNLHQVDISSNVDPTDLLNIKSIMNKDVLITDPLLMKSLFDMMTKKTFQHENFVKLMNDQTQKFDLIIAEWLFSELYSGLSVVFDCPYIWAASTEPHRSILELIDEVPNPAYVPDIWSLEAPPLNFVQRIQELVLEIKKQLIWPLFGEYENDYKHIFGPVLAKRGRVLPPYDVVKYNASLIIANSHISLGQAVRLPQSFKPVAGYHIDTNLKPLSKDLQTIMDNAKDGVIYFSMGSNLKSKDMPEEIKKDLLKMFSGLKQTIIWKFEEELQDLPKNVHILKWAPQLNIISHKNCRIFITHGGLLSTIEALHYGIPLIGIPMFGDQFINVKRFIAKGFAIKVDMTYSIADDLKDAIEEMLHNPKYADKVKELSRIYHDRPVPPGRELVHWVEHVVRTRGAAHLRSPALMVPWYQKMYLDFFVLILIILIIIYNAVKKIITYFYGSKSKRNTKVSKKKD